MMETFNRQAYLVYIFGHVGITSIFFLLIVMYMRSYLWIFYKLNSPAVTIRPNHKNIRFKIHKFKCDVKKSIRY